MDRHQGLSYRTKRTRISSCMGRAHGVRAVERPVGLSRASRSAAIEEMLYANDRYWVDDTKVSFDPHQLAWVASDDIAEISPKLSDRPPAKSEKVTVTYPSPQQAVLEVELESPGLVVLADVYYPGWQLTIDDKPAPIYRVNQLMRGALVPAEPSPSGLHVHAAIVPGRPRGLGRGPGRACCCFGLFCNAATRRSHARRASLIDSLADESAQRLDRST